jgi:membrane fusion protein, macrolide-specific efflux system
MPTPLIRSFARAPRVVLIVVGSLLLALILVIHLVKAHRAPAFITAVATTGDIEDTVLATGTVQAYKQVSVGAQASGQLKKLNVALGQEVKSGNLIAVIDPMTEEQALLNAQAALDAVRAQRRGQVALLKQDRLEFDRQREMLPAHATSQAAYDTAEATFNSTRASIANLDAQIVQAQSAVDAAKVNLGYTRITAPMDGEVVAVITQQGQTVIASQIAPTIIKLARLDIVTIKIQISEADVVRVKPRQEVYFTILGEPDHRYQARLRAVEPAPESINSDTGLGSGSSAASGASGGATSQAVYYNGLFDVPNPNRTLRIGMTVQANIVLDQAQRALLIPSTALMPSPTAAAPSARGHWATVQVLDARGRPVKRAVLVGINNNVNAQIVSGLRAGERVVIGTASATIDQNTRRAMD